MTSDPTSSPVPNSNSLPVNNDGTEPVPVRTCTTTSAETKNLLIADVIDGGENNFTAAERLRIMDNIARRIFAEFKKKQNKEIIDSDGNPQYIYSEESTNTVGRPRILKN